MRTFFHGGRRKLGCVALLLACVVAGMWFRSQIYGDFILLNRGVHLNDFLSSFQGSIKWIKSTAPAAEPPNELQRVGPFISLDVERVVSPRYAFSMTERYKHMDETLMPVFGGSDIEWRWHWQGAGFHFGAGTVSGYQFEVALVPYWFATILLTLLSAYLLLWTPQKRASSALGDRLIREHEQP